MSSDALQFQLDRIQAQLEWLEREITFLRQEIANSKPDVLSAYTFAGLHGLWEEVVVDEEDFQLSRVRLPESI